MKSGVDGGTRRLSGWVSAVPDGLQSFGLEVLLCPLKFVTEDPGLLSDDSPLSELLVRRSSLQSL